MVTESMELSTMEKEDKLIGYEALAPADAAPAATTAKEQNDSKVEEMLPSAFQGESVVVSPATSQATFPAEKRKSLHQNF